MSKSTIEPSKEPRAGDEEAVIKLMAWQVPYLLGSARLGMYAEDWCAALIQANLGTYDTHSARWICKVGSIIDQIKQQTRITQENLEYGYDKILDDITVWISEKCVEGEKSLEQFYAKEAKSREK